MSRRVVFKKQVRGFVVREYNSDQVEAIYLSGFERSYRRMSELAQEGFQIIHHDSQKIVYEKGTK